MNFNLWSARFNPQESPEISNLQVQSSSSSGDDTDSILVPRLVTPAASYGIQLPSM